MTGPADTIREALLSDTTTTTADVSEALAALTELEADRDRLQIILEGADRTRVAIAADRDRLADTLREIADGDYDGASATVRDFARAALDRHTKAEA